MFRFEIEGIGIAVAFGSGEILKATKVNPKFKVTQRSYLRQFITNILGDKYKSNYDASKGLKTALKNAELFARVAIVEGAKTDTSLQIPSILKIYKADSVPLKTRSDADKLATELRGFAYEKSPPEADASLESTRALVRVKAGLGYGEEGVEAGFDDYDPIPF